MFSDFKISSSGIQSAWVIFLSDNTGFILIFLCALVVQVSNTSNCALTPLAQQFLQTPNDEKRKSNHLDFSLPR